MYTSQHVHGQLTVGDQRSASRQAAERYAQVSAAAEARRERAGVRRRARARRHRHFVTVA